MDRRRKSTGDGKRNVVNHVEQSNKALYETIVRDGKPVLLGGQNGMLDEFDEISVDDPGEMIGFSIIRPYIPSAVKDRILFLPDGCDEYGTPQDLFREILLHIRRYVDLPEKDVKFCAWYAMFTWLFGDHEDLTELPYLRFRGDTGTGKSRAVEVIGDLSYHPYVTDSTITEAALFRLVKQYAPTIVIDEGDIKDSDDTNPLITALLTGFSKKGGPTRCDLDNQTETVTYVTFCPKILGTRFDYQSVALESRCWTVHMHKSGRKLHWKLPRAYHDETRALQRKLLRFRFDWYWEVDWDTSGLLMSPDFDGIEPRLLQATNVILAMSSLFPDLYGEYQAFILERQKGLVKDMQNSPHGRVVMALFSLIRELWVGRDADPGYEEIPRLSITPSAIMGRLEEMNLGHFETSVIGRYLRDIGLETDRKWDGFQKKTVNRIVLDDVNCLKSIESKYINKEDTILTDITVITDITEPLKSVSRQNYVYDGGGLTHAQVHRKNRNNRNNCKDSGIDDSCNAEVEEDTLQHLEIPCAGCGKDYDFTDVESIGGAYYCPKCQKERHLEYLGRSGAKAGGEV